MRPLEKCLNLAVETKWRNSDHQCAMHSQMSKVIKQINPAKIDQRAIDDCILLIQRLWKTPTTARRVANVFKSMIRTGQRYGELDSQLFVDPPKVQTQRRDIIPEEQIEQIRSIYAKHDVTLLLMFDLVSGLGLRGFGSELLQLRRRDLDTARGTLTVTAKKGGYEIKRRCPLNLHLSTALINHIDFNHLAKDDHLFLPREVSNLRTVWNTTVRKQVGSDLTPYQLRHSYATKLLRSGVPIHVVQRVLGHTNIQTTMQYAHVMDDDLEKVKEVI